jgi:hypothetical protein
MSFRAIVIDPRMQRIIEAQLPEQEEDTLEALQALVGGYIELAWSFPNGDALFVNDMARIDGEDACFALHNTNGPHMGQGVIVGGTPNGETCGARSSLADIKVLVLFGRMI